MTVEVEIAGAVRRIELDKDGAQWVVRVDGRSFRVDARPVGGGWSLLVDCELPRGTTCPGEQDVPAPGDGDLDVRRCASFDVSLENGEPGDWIACVNGEPVAARLADPRARRGRGREARAAAGSRMVTSAMPGRIVKVLVKPGDRVADRQPLLVVEAMKMENELRAPGDALVRDVNVTEGMSVEAGAILIVLE